MHNLAALRTPFARARSTGLISFCCGCRSPLTEYLPIRPSRVHGAQTRSVCACAAAARDIPVFRFSRPLGFHALGEAVDVLEDHLSDLQYHHRQRNGPVVRQHGSKPVNQSGVNGYWPVLALRRWPFPVVGISPRGHHSVVRMRHYELIRTAGSMLVLVQGGPIRCVRILRPPLPLLSRRQ
jgi:hypothetical protein